MAERSKALDEAQARYDGQQRKIMVRLDRRTEADLIERLEREDSMQAYIKRLIRQDMADEYAKNI